MKFYQVSTLLILGTAINLHAFSLSDLTGKKKEDSQQTNAQETASDSEIPGESELPGFSFDFAKDQLSKAFSSAQPDTRDLLDKTLSTFADGEDKAFFNHLGKLTDLDLTPSQQAALQAVKNDLMAAVLLRNFSFDNTRDSERLQQTIAAVRSGNVSEIKSSVSELRQAATLSEQQEELLDQVLANAPSVIQSSLDSLLP